MGPSLKFALIFHANISDRLMRGLFLCCSATPFHVSTEAHFLLNAPRMMNEAFIARLNKESCTEFDRGSILPQDYKLRSGIDTSTNAAIQQSTPRRRESPGMTRADFECRASATTMIFRFSRLLALHYSSFRSIRFARNTKLISVAEAATCCGFAARTGVEFKRNNFCKVSTLLGQNRDAFLE